MLLHIDPKVSSFDAKFDEIFPTTSFKLKLKATRFINCISTEMYNARARKKVKLSN